MKPILISICVLFLSYGCSTLDTTTKEESGSFTIQRWAGNGWIDTADKLSVSYTWRFVSHFESDDGRVVIIGGYTLDMSNPSDNDVQFSIDRLRFLDTIDIPIDENMVIPTIHHTVSANSTNYSSDTFHIRLHNIDTAIQITTMILAAEAKQLR